MTMMSVSLAEESTSVDDEKNKRLLRSAKTSSTEERTSDVIKSEEGIKERELGVIKSEEGIEERTLDVSKLAEEAESLLAKPISFFRARSWQQQQLTSEEVLAKTSRIPLNKSPVISTTVDENVVAHAREFWNGLSKPDMLALIKLFVERTKKNPDKNLSLFDMLSAIYGDINVTKMFAAAKSLDDFRGRAAKKLLDEKLNAIMRRPCSVDRFVDVYNIKGDDLFTSSLWKVMLLKDFIRKSNAYLRRHITLADTLVTAYGGEKGLMRVLLKLDNDAEARHVLDEIAKRWYRKNLSVDGTMQLLELSEVDKVFDNRRVHYVEGLLKQCRKKEGNQDWEDDFINADFKISDHTREEYIDEFMASFYKKETVDYVKALVDFYDDKTLAVMILKAHSSAEGDAEMTATIRKANSMLFRYASDGERVPKALNEDEIAAEVGPLDDVQRADLHSFVFRYNTLVNRRLASEEKKAKKRAAKNKSNHQ
uniref:RxLR effector candidate protein n=2 Tax=Hyaloperonospora arabidopsidis (strain Emoy2) TaxID=559515 RepID=M4BH80_HYAAE